MKKIIIFLLCLLSIGLASAIISIELDPDNPAYTNRDETITGYWTFLNEVVFNDATIINKSVLNVTGRIEIINTTIINPPLIATLRALIYDSHDSLVIDAQSISQNYIYLFPTGGVVSIGSSNSNTQGTLLLYDQNGAMSSIKMDTGVLKIGADGSRSIEVIPGASNGQNVTIEGSSAPGGTPGNVIINGGTDYGSSYGFVKIGEHTREVNISSPLHILDGLFIEDQTTGIENYAIKTGLGKIEFGDQVDMNGNEFILDADGDSSITADTDDQIDFKVGGSDLFQLDGTGLHAISVPFDANGNLVRLDADGDSWIKATTDNQVKIGANGVTQATLTPGEFNIPVASYYSVGTYNGASGVLETISGPAIFIGGIVYSIPECPYIFVLSQKENGVIKEQFDNDIFSEYKGIQNEHLDVIPLKLKPYNDNDTYLIEVTQNDPAEEITHIDQLELIEILHPEGNKLATDQEGNIYSFSEEIPLSYAITDSGEDILSRIGFRVEDHPLCQEWPCTLFRNSPEETYYSWKNESHDYKATWIELYFKEPIEYLIINADKCSYSVWLPNLLFKDGKEYLAEINLHERWTDNIIKLPRPTNVVYIKREKENPKISYVAGLNKVSDHQELQMQLISIINNKGRNVMQDYLYRDKERDTLYRGDYIDLRYKATAEAPEGMQKDFALKGYGFSHGAKESIKGEEI